MNKIEVFGDLKCRHLEYDCKRQWQIELVHTHGFPAGPLTWMPLMSLLVEHHPRLPGGTGAVEPLQKGGQVSTSSQKEEWHTLVCRRTPCRQLPRRWTGSDTHFQRPPHQLQHMQGHQLPRSRDLRSGVKHLSHLFRKSGTHLRLLLLQPLLLPLQACRRREERSLQNSETMPTVATLSFPPRQANNCDQSSAISILMKIISQPKNSLFVISPSISFVFPFSKPSTKQQC